jgi:hypothetical protein
MGTSDPCSVVGESNVGAVCGPHEGREPHEERHSDPCSVVGESNVGAVCGPHEGREHHEEGHVGQVRPLRGSQVWSTGRQNQHCQKHPGRGILKISLSTV